MNIIKALANDTYGNFSLTRGRENFYFELKGSWFILTKYINGGLIYEIEVNCLVDIDHICFDDLIFIVKSELEVENDIKKLKELLEQKEQHKKED